MLLGQGAPLRRGRQFLKCPRSSRAGSFTNSTGKRPEIQVSPLLAAGSAGAGASGSLGKGLSTPCSASTAAPILLRPPSALPARAPAPRFTGETKSDGEEMSTEAKGIPLGDPLLFKLPCWAQLGLIIAAVHRTLCSAAVPGPPRHEGRTSVSQRAGTREQGCAQHRQHPKVWRCCTGRQTTNQHLSQQHRPRVRLVPTTTPCTAHLPSAKTTSATGKPAWCPLPTPSPPRQVEHSVPELHKLLIPADGEHNTLSLLVPSPCPALGRAALCCSSAPPARSQRAASLTLGHTLLTAAEEPPH